MFASTYPEYESADVSKPRPPEHQPGYPLISKPLEVAMYIRELPAIQTSGDSPEVGAKVGTGVGFVGDAVVGTGVGAKVGLIYFWYTYKPTRIRFFRYKR